MQEVLDAILEAGVARGAVPGVAATVVDRDGTVYEGAAGERAIGTGVAMTTDTVGAIFSMTKAITGAAAMQLVERGIIDLDAPASAVCEELADPVVLTGFDGDGQPITRPAASEPTLRQLLTHTSGFVYDIWDADMTKWYAATGAPSLFSLQKAALRTPLAFDPGTKWEYGIGIDWAGRIVEMVSGQPLAKFFDDNLLGPLGMRDTRFVLDAGQQRRLVAAAARTPDGIARIDFEFPTDGDFHMGGGGLYSTGPDYLRFTRMLLGGGALDGVRVLAAETVKRMGENAIGDIEVPIFVSDNPAMALTVEMFPGQIKRWGLSFVINTEPVPGGRAAGSLAWAGVHNTFYWMDPITQLTAVLMMQLLPANDPQVLDVLLRYEQALYAARA